MDSNNLGQVQQPPLTARLIERRQQDVGPPRNVGERRAGVLDQEALRQFMDERKVADAVNRARLEDIALKNNKYRDIRSWISVIASFFALLYPVYKDYKDEGKAADVLSKLGTSGEQLRLDLNEAQNRYRQYEQQIKAVETDVARLVQDTVVRSTKLDSLFLTIDNRVEDAIDNIKDLQQSINKLNIELTKQETIISVLQDRLRIRRTDYEGAPQ